MNTYTLTNRNIARIMAFVTVFAMIVSAFATPLNVAFATELPEVVVCTDESALNFNAEEECDYPEDTQECESDCGESVVPALAHVCDLLTANMDLLEDEGFFDQVFPFIDEEQNIVTDMTGWEIYEELCGEDEGGDDSEENEVPNDTAACEFDGYKFDEQSNPLKGWTIGLMKSRTYDNGQEITTVLFDLASDVTDETGYYCLTWNGSDGLPENTEDTPPYEVEYYVYEVLQDGWTNMLIQEEGIDVPEGEIFTGAGARVGTPVGVFNEELNDVLVITDAEYSVDFYNTQDDDGGGNGTTTDRFTLTVTITGEGEGGVTGSSTLDEVDAIQCHSSNGELIDCSETYASGTVVTLVATADEGSNFDNSWTAGFGSCTGNTTPCQLTMTQNVDLIAHFDRNSTGGGGGGGGRRSSGSSNDNDDDDNTPDGEVLGEQVTVVPEGAPDAGAGGASTVFAFAPFFGAATRRFSVKLG